MFPFLEKILTVSAREYVESAGKSLADYNMVGVHKIGEDIKRGSSEFDLTHFLKSIPGEAEAVVAYRLVRLEGHLCAHSGTALIPRNSPARGSS